MAKMKKKGTKVCTNGCQMILCSRCKRESCITHGASKCNDKWYCIACEGFIYKGMRGLKT